MGSNEFKKSLEGAVVFYIANEEEYGDNSVLEIDPVSLKVNLESEIRDEERYDYYQVMDFLQMSLEEPGKWIVDSEAIEDVVKEYAVK